MRKIQKIFHTVGFKIFKSALVRFFAPPVYLTRFPTVRLVSKAFVRSSMVLYEENHCITGFFPYAARADKDFHGYSMYILPVSHHTKPYGTRDDNDSSMKNLKMARIRTKDYARPGFPNVCAIGRDFCTPATLRGNGNGCHRQKITLKSTF